jgi:acetyltransferase-like isoleucine patch superfamily enzyme
MARRGDRQGALKEAVKAGPLGPPLAAARERTEGLREGLVLLFTLALGRLPGRRPRTFLARRLLGLRVHRSSILYRWKDLRRPSGIEIGEGTVVGFWASLDGRRGIQIGKNVNFSSEVALWTLQHDPNDREFGVRGGPIVIEDLAWISFRATILPGVRVGRGAVVAANSVVTKDVEPYAIVAGIPARVVGRRREDLDYSFDDGGGPWFV